MLTQASGLDEVIHPMHKALVLVEALAAEDVDTARALEGSGLLPESLNDSAARMSARQLLAVFRNAMHLSRDPLFAMKAGRRVHATHLGFFGFALMCSATSREALQALHRYRPLSTPIIGVKLAEEAGQCVLTYFDSLDLGEDLFRFVLDFQISLARTLLDDTMGPDFVLAAVQLGYPDDGQTEQRQALLGAPVVYGSEHNRMLWDSQWLDRPQPYANSLTATVVRETCEQMLARAQLQCGMAGAVARMLEEQLGHFPGIEEVASRLHVTSRTLRRKLQAEGTSFAEILASVRKRLAIQYLRTSRMKTEDIAQSLGFSDAANFRHAFRRWTNRRPSDYRHADAGAA